MLEHGKYWNGRLIEEICRHTLPDECDEHLLERLRALFPEGDVRLARVGNPWFRLGGVVDGAGHRIARDVGEWAERTFLECGRNIQALVEHTREQKLIATRHQGVTLYFAARTGDAAENFVQIEIDKSREVADRLMLSEGSDPEDLEEIVDPIEPVSVEPFSIGPARYLYRRRTDVALFMAQMSRHHPERHPAQRFMDDWNRSSAGRHATFCDDWILRLSQNTGRFGEQLMNAEVVNVHREQLPHLQELVGKRGKALATLLTRFDRQAGYPFAWFFYMVKGMLVSPHCGEMVHHDLCGDYAYLPERDAAVLRDWIARPYGV